MSSLRVYDIIAREILASNGFPSIEVKLYYSEIDFVTASYSFGASAGSREAITLFDNDPTRYNGLGMLKARDFINSKIKSYLVGKSFDDIFSFDKALITFDNSIDLSLVGCNSILPLSICACKAFAKINNISIYQFISTHTNSTSKIPAPMMVAIEGGKHADNSTDFQEYCLSYIGNNSNVSDQIQIVLFVYHKIKGKLKELGYSTNVGNEGAFAPNGIASNFEPIKIIESVLNSLGLESEVGISIDAAASEFSEKTKDGYLYKIKGAEKEQLTSAELATYYSENFNSKSIVSQEDFFHEMDYDAWENWQKKSSALKIGDDLTVTNQKLLQMAIDKPMIDGVIIKPNQIGLMSRLIDTVNLAIKNNIELIVSHRGGGETNDDFISDLAVGIGAKWLKCGPTRGERVSKYNRLMEIEQEMRIALKNTNKFEA